MESFEFPNQNEVPSISPREIEGIGNEILLSPELVNYLIAKIKEKIDFKERVSYDDGTNNFSVWKRLGLFIIHEQSLPEELVSILQKNGVDIEDGDVLELHIPPQDQDVSLREVGRSFDRLREYLMENSASRDIPKYIYGVSYLASLAERWGFTIVDIPKELQETSGAANLLRSYASAIGDHKKRKIAKLFGIEDIKLCYISTEDLLFGKK